MNMNEAARIIGVIFPNAQWGDDNDGQIVLYTNMRESADGTLVAFDDEVTA